MGQVHSGNRNPNWRAGRTVTEHGYVLIRLPGHPMADCRGYVYEHRLVAAQRAGRTLRDEEVVHHINGDRSDNRAENLELCPTGAHHRMQHRTTEIGRRNPGEVNREVTCECGCGTMFSLFDGSGRPRRYLPGHNPNRSPTLAAVRGAVLAGIDRREAIAAAVGISAKSVSTAVCKLVRRGELSRMAMGVYGPPGSEPVKFQQVIKCECGCGREFNRFDSTWRERRFVSGHNNGQRDTCSERVVKSATRG